MSKAFDDAFEYVVGHEGKLSMDPHDRGNWTTGQVGFGELRGTMFGISAMAYPNEDIQHLTLDRAKFLMKRDYWDIVHGDDLPPGIALGLFDSAINQGVAFAVRALQGALRVTQDGNLGPVTIAAVAAANPHWLARGFAISRVIRYSASRLWDEDGAGWVGRTLDTYDRMKG